MLYYTFHVDMHNRTSTPVPVDSISITPAVPYSCDLSLPLVVNPNQHASFNLTLRYDFTTASTVSIGLYGDGEALAKFAADLSRWNLCAQPDSCKVGIECSADIDQSIAVVNQSVFLNYTFTFGSLVGHVLKVTCDQEDVGLHDPYFDGIGYHVTLVLDCGLLSQLVADSADYCFHFTFCTDDTLCVSDVCVSSLDLWEIYNGLVQGRPKGSRPLADGTILPAREPALALVPNPATNMVRIVDAKSGQKVGNIIKISIFSMVGQLMAEYWGTDRFDVSDLPTGGYIVKIAEEDNKNSYIKLLVQ